MKTETPMPVAPAAPAERDSASHYDAFEPAAFHLSLKNILVPLDFSEFSLKALRYAVPFAHQFGATLTLLHVVELPAYSSELPYPPALPLEDHDTVVRQLEEIRRKEIPEDVNVHTTVRHNFVFEAILEVAREIPADLIVTTTHGRTGLMHMLMGSTAENVVRKAPCSVLVVRNPEPASP